MLPFGRQAALHSLVEHQEKGQLTQTKKKTRTLAGGRANIMIKGLHAITNSGSTDRMRRDIQRCIKKEENIK